MGCRQRGAMLMAGLAVIFMVIMAAALPRLQAASQVAEYYAQRPSRCQRRGGTAPEQVSHLVAEIYGTALIAGAKKGQAVTTELFYMTQNLKVLSSTDRFAQRRRGHPHFRLPQTRKRLADR